jgi:hypothetical protein
MQLHDRQKVIFRTVSQRVSDFVSLNEGIHIARWLQVNIEVLA